MNQEDMDKLQDAISIIFEIEQRWRENRYDYAADTLYKARIEINNARSRGQRTKEGRNIKQITVLGHTICYYSSSDGIEITIEENSDLFARIWHEITKGCCGGETRLFIREEEYKCHWYIV